MQTTKDYIRKLLLETAQKAFFEKGFKSVSMREISKLSGIGLSNIYNYYPCKDDLLVDVLRPLLAAMYRMLEDHNRPENFSLDIFISDEYHRASLQELMGIITRYRSELNLLFFYRPTNEKETVPFENIQQNLLNLLSNKSVSDPLF